MIYQSQPTGPAGISKVYVINYDPVTGEISTTNQGTFAGVQQQQSSLNGGHLLYGASFGLSAKGLAFYYSGVDPNGQYQIFRWYTNATNPPTAITSGPYPKLGGPLPTTNPSDTATSMIYMQKYTTAGTDEGFLNVWKEGTSTQTGASVPINPKSGSTEGPRWLENLDGTTIPKISTNLLDRNGVNQAALYDANSRTTTILTTDSKDKIDPKMLAAPEYNGEQIVVTQLGHSKIGVYRQINNQWTLINTTTVPYPSGQVAYLANPIPFAYNGKSYVMMVAGVQMTGNTQTTDAWILSVLDNSIKLKVSNYSGPLRTIYDPEVVVSSANSLLVSYVATPQPGSGSIVNSMHVSQVFLPTTSTGIQKVGHAPAMIHSLAMMPFLGVALVTLLVSLKKR
jgi:hypothetical protein